MRAPAPTRRQRGEQLLAWLAFATAAAGAALLTFLPPH